MSHTEHQAAAPARLRVAVLTLSDSRTPGTDSSGKYLRDRLVAAGHDVADYRVVREEPGALRLALLSYADRGNLDAVVCNGGTGISPRDGTYEALEQLLEKRLDGFGELFRALSFQEVGASAMLSRACAGLLQGLVVVAVPGSPAAVRLAWEKILEAELPHMVGVARGPDPRAAEAKQAAIEAPKKPKVGSAKSPKSDPPARPWKIKHLAEIPHEDIYGARIIRTLERDELPQVGADYVIVGPGCALEPHRHEKSESFLFIVKGSAIVDLEGEKRTVQAGDFIYVPPKVFHGFETKTEPCEFYSIQSPPIYPVGEPADITFSDGSH